MPSLVTQPFIHCQNTSGLADSGGSEAILTDPTVQVLNPKWRELYDEI